jgi:ABC-type polysaccharide/polyol phosphate export permease
MDLGNGMNRYLTFIRTFIKYYFLLTLLVKKDLKKKYKGSILGVLWSLINPLLNMIVITIVFSTLFKNSVDNFPVYLLSGLLLFGFFSTSTSTSMKSVISAASLINKVAIPKYIITLANTISNFIFFNISLIVLVLIMLVTKAEITLNIIYAPLYLFLFFLFSCGISFILATVTVFFRDIEHLYGVLITALMYASAIFYPTSIIPDKYQFILTLNPIYYFISGFRDVVYTGVPIDSNNILICIGLAGFSMFIGITVFEKNKDKFIFYV